MEKLTFIGKIKINGGSKFVAIPPLVLQLLKLQNEDILEVAVRKIIIEED